MNRRNLILSGAAVVAAAMFPAIPALALPTPVVFDEALRQKLCEISAEVFRLHMFEVVDNATQHSMLKLAEAWVSDLGIRNVRVTFKSSDEVYEGVSGFNAVVFEYRDDFGNKVASTYYSVDVGTMPNQKLTQHIKEMTAQHS